MIDKLISVPDFNSGAYATNFFKHSWVLSSELDDVKFLDKLETLHLKDKERDPNAFNMKWLIVYEVRKKETFLISIKNFLELTHEQRIHYFSTEYDFYIPRSIWFRSFALLKLEELPFLKEFTI